MSSRIIRLQYNFLSQSIEPFNIALPWNFSTRDGMFKMNYSQDSAVRDDLLFWANTNKGEYVMDPEFGLDVRRYLFNPTSIIKDNLVQNAREQLPRYFPQLTATSIQVLTQDEIPEISDNEIIFKLDAFFTADKDRRVSIEESIR